MSLSQMQVFNKYIMPATIETLAQMVDKFNAASNGAIRLTTEGFEGDFLQESFFAAIHSAQRRVNRYGANGAAASTDLTQLKHNSVKIAGGLPTRRRCIRLPSALRLVLLHLPSCACCPWPRVLQPLPTAPTSSATSKRPTAISVSKRRCRLTTPSAWD